MNGILYSGECDFISKKKLKSVKDYLYFLKTEPYKSILNILIIAPSFDDLYKEGLKIRELRNLILNDSKIDEKLINKKRFDLLKRFEKHLLNNKINEVKLHQKLKIGEIKEIKTKKVKEKLIERNVTNLDKYTPRTSSTEYTLFNPYLLKLERTGLIQRSKGYCFISKSNILLFKNMFKIQDIRLLEECPANCIYSKAFSYDKDKTGRTTAAKCISIYGLDKRHVQIDEILDPAFKKLRRYVDNIYCEKLCNILIDESKKIKNDKLMKTVEEWHSQIKKINFLYTPRFRNEINSMPIEFKFAPPENLEKEFKEITEKIWNRFIKECPPIGIMIRL